MRCRLLAVSVLMSMSSFYAQAEDLEFVELQTNLGTIVVELDYTHAPISSNNFITYVNSGFYKNTLIHRVVKGFVVQGGGFNKADGKQKTTNSPIVNESTNGLSNVTGTIAMARTSDPNSATSQFFINLVDNTGLDYVSPSSPGYAVFGKVIDGMGVVKAIEKLANYNSFAYTSNSDVVFIEKTFASSQYDTSISKTRITINGLGKVASQPAGIQCGSQCTLTKPASGTLKLTATPNTGYLFAGWRGDCVGLNATITLDLSKGNHNCTAQFSKPVTSAQ
ncbi:peptidylprolyl isomerase [Methylocucumis oryzae]|uniref:peptidylprolyl isomerase n=1 Tax=Methylocucumis oryzae TaxID=1632867 RepID=UPI000695D7CB|nr:peptidylprolyl isomerase [Methylocucumis oryzae]